MRIGKIVAIAVVVMLGFMAYWYVFANPVEDGAPQTTIEVVIEKVSTSQEASATIELNDKAVPFTALAPSFPMTTTDVGVPFVEPESIYQISFFVNVIATPQSPAITGMLGEVSISGQNAYGSDYENSYGEKISAIEDPMSPSVENTFEFAQGVEEGNFAWVYMDRDGTDPVQNAFIKGADINDSTFSFQVNVIATDVGAETVFGTATADIILKVGVGGDIDVTITDITATALEQP